MGWFLRASKLACGACCVCCGVCWVCAGGWFCGSGFPMKGMSCEAGLRTAPAILFANVPNTGVLLMALVMSGPALVFHTPLMSPPTASRKLFFFFFGCGIIL